MPWDAFPNSVLVPTHSIWPSPCCRFVFQTWSVWLMPTRWRNSTQPLTSMQDEMHRRLFDLPNEVLSLASLFYSRRSCHVSTTTTYQQWQKEQTVAILNTNETRKPTNWWTVLNATTPIPELPSHIMLAITCSENVYARPCGYGRTRMCELNATIMRKYPFA